MTTDDPPEYMLFADGSVKQFPATAHAQQIQDLLAEWGGTQYYWRSTLFNNNHWIMVRPGFGNGNLQNVVLPDVIKLAVMLE